jgi:DNA-binding CsgD family transcriptional regulator/phage portal protein BeeE
MGVIDTARQLAKRTLFRDSDTPLNFLDFLSYFNYGGLGYSMLGSPLFGSQALGEKQEIPQASFEGYIRGIYKRNGIIFACMVARMLPFSEARFQFRRRINGRPGELFGTPELDVLEHPWPNATTGDLLSRMIQDADLAGNGFATSPRNDRIYRMRPDWTTIVVGSRSKPDSDEPGNEVDAEVIGYIYKRGGSTRGAGNIEVLMPDQVAHFAPIPDPEFRFRGMSWLMPVLQETLGDAAATAHKLKFFENGATPNLSVALDKSIVDPKIFKQFVDIMEEEHTGVLNAYKTLYLAGGATTQVVGANMRQIDFKVTQGAGETRIAAAARIPPIIVGLSEGLDAATYSNYGQAKRAFADMTLRPYWRNIAGSFASIVNVPDGAELWYDDRDIPFLREDIADRADVQSKQAVSIRQLVDGGYKPESVVKAIMNEDFSMLEHSGLYSVQLQSPGSQKLPDAVPGETPATPIAGPKPTPVPTPMPTPMPTKPTPKRDIELSVRERQVVREIAAGATNKAIAATLGMSERTVERHVSSLMEKVGVASRAELVAWHLQPA